MTIQYVLHPNRLTADPSDYAARVRITGSVDLEGLTRRIMEQGSTVTRPDILAVLENTIQAAESFLLEGYRINLGGLCDLYPRLRGTFNGITDVFDSTRHRVELGAGPGIRLRRAFREQATVAKIETNISTPSLLSFEDLSSGQINTAVTPGNIGVVNGHRLKFDPAQADEGVYFINTADGTEYKVTAIQKNKPGQQVFLIPAIPATTNLNLEVRAHFGTELRSGRLDTTLDT